ncbi:MAG: nuclease domain-containing protein [Spirochaetia bacterium]|nr:nuclease domain-containing protein [Spirochaetia bacterium]
MKELIYPAYNKKEKNIQYGYTIENSNYKVSYNRTFSKNRKESYSHNFRPDITIQKNKKYYLLDAKFKNSLNLNENANIDSDDKININFKYNDIDKMHSYLDAIYGADIAMILYPGSKFAFYQKEYPKKELLSKESILKKQKIKGVGAIPIDVSNDAYKKILDIIKTID